MTAKLTNRSRSASLHRAIGFWGFVFERGKNAWEALKIGPILFIAEEFEHSYQLTSFGRVLYWGKHWDRSFLWSFST